jgi:hypothetical protein
MAFNFGGAASSMPVGGSSAFGFGAAAAPQQQQPLAPAATSFFGAPPAAAAAAAAAAASQQQQQGGYGFGAPAAPQQSAAAPSPFSAPTGSFFGTPAPAPSTGGFFGAPPAPATGTGSLFGAPAATGSLFGNPPASAPFSFASAPQQQQQQQQQSSLFGAPPPQYAQQQQQQQQQPAPVASNVPAISGNMYYSQLTPQMKQMIDTMHEAMVQHKKTMFQLQSMGPQLLQKKPDASKFSRSAVESHATGITPLQENIQQLQVQLERLQQDMKKLHATIQKQHGITEQAVVQATIYATWPVEGLAARKGVVLPISATVPVDADSEEKKNEESLRQHDVQAKIRQALTRGMAAVDRIDRMPSPYYWDTLHALEQRTVQLTEEMTSLQSQLEQRISQRQWSAASVQDVIESQHVLVHRLSGQLDQIRDAMQCVRLRYRQYEKGENVLDAITIAEQESQRILQEKVLLHYLQAASAAPSTNVAATPSVGTNPGMYNNPTTTSFGGFAATNQQPSASPFSFNSSAAPSASTSLPPAAPAIATNPAPTTTTTTNLFGTNVGAAPVAATGFGTGFASSTSLSGSSTKKNRNSSRNTSGGRSKR